MPCSTLERELKTLQTERARLQKELRAAAPGAKARLVAQIVALGRQLRAKSEEYDECLIQHPPVVAPAPKLIMAAGTVELRTSHPAISGPYQNAVAATLRFSGANRTGVSVATIDIAPFQQGRERVAFVLTGSTIGQYDPALGAIERAGVTLMFDLSNDLWGDSLLTLSLSTEWGDPLKGSRLDRSRHVVLTGAGRFEGGFLLHGSSATVIASLQLAEIP